jgi:hypothetical protein
MTKLLPFYLYVCRAFTESRVRTYENDMGIDPAVVAQLDTPHYTTIQWIDTVKDFGTAKKGDSVFVRFRFKNTGDNSLFISEVLPSCGCTVASYPHKPIFPGDTGELRAAFDSHGYKGLVEKHVEVTTNTSNRIKQTVSFRGIVNDSLP